MKLEEIVQCYGINCVDDVFNMARCWENRIELLKELKKLKMPWDAECLEMLIRYNFIKVIR